MMDFHACRWPEPQLNALDDSLAQYFDKMNDGPLSPVCQSLDLTSDRSTAGHVAMKDAAESDMGPERPVVITFSHFLPYQVKKPHLPAPPFFDSLNAHA